MTYPSEKRVFYFIFFILSVVSLIPVWAYPYFPSQDGPAHLGSVATQLALGKGLSDLDGVYVSQWRLETNQLYFLLLYALGALMPLLLVEKLLLTCYVVGLPLASLFACRLGRGVELAALLAFPLVYSLPLYTGFYTFCFSLPLFVLSLGLYLRFMRSPTLLWGGAFSAALVGLYFVHVVTALFALVWVLAMVAVRASTKAVSFRVQFLTLGAALPAALLATGFITSFSQFSEPSSVAVESSSVVARLLEPVHKPLSPYRKVVYVLDGFSKGDRVYSVPYFVLVAALIVAAARAALQKGEVRAQLPLALTGLLFVGLLALVPERYGPLGWLPGRLLPITCLVLVVYLSKAPLPRWFWYLSSLVVVLVTSISVAYRLPVHGRLNQAIADYASVGASLEPGATLLPLHLEPRYEHEELKVPLRRARFDALTHAAGYLNVEAPLINLRNYQPARPYFPLQYRAGYDPRVYLSPDDGLSQFEQPPFHLELGAYTRRTGILIDYVLVWGDPERLASPGMRDVYAQLNAEYALVAVSPLELAYLYEHKSRIERDPDAPTR